MALRETRGVELLNWGQGQETWLRVPIPGVRSRYIRVAPDATFTLGEAGHPRHFFLEMDRSTEEHSRLLRKFLGYWWYLQSLEFHEAHPGSRRVNVLFVTTGHQRMLNMMETLRRLPKPNRASHGGKGLFLFCLESDYTVAKPPLLLGTIWRNVNRPETRLPLHVMPQFA